MRRHKFFNRVLLPLMILLPILFSLAIRNRMGTTLYTQIISYLQLCFANSGFLSHAAQYDATIYCIILNKDNGIMLIQGVLCVVMYIILLKTAIKSRNRRMMPFVVLYTILALLLSLCVCGDYAISYGLETLYNRLMLYGFYIRVFHGPLPIVLYSAMIASYAIYMVSEEKCS